ncbi:MAG: DUF3501 family protein [Alphaproteobacteria bacterium]|nr:DUF3501 family protein [Alphaproteobacteria bacterium]MBM3731856.1 DUF3501 family protein [Acidimicrobiia bacterium]
MTPNPHAISPADIMPMADYAKVRAERRRLMARAKIDRRVPVGPDATFYFENYATMLHQVHEMLFVEKGGAEQIPGEIAAYDPLVPKGSNLSATFMIEIEDPNRRLAVLKTLGGIENTISLAFAGETVKGVAHDDAERTTEDGKTSSVHFFSFPFTKTQIEKFRKAGTEVVLAIRHPNYAHMAILPEATRAALAKDFD